jgi:hypothetical protein
MAADDAAVAETPTYLVPKMGEFAVSNTAFFTSMYLTEVEPPEAGMQELDDVIDPFEGPLAQAAKAPLTAAVTASTRPAIGVLMTHEQGWFQKGLALGQLIHSLCLAPGEVTKVAVIDWQRREAARDAAQTDQSEAVSALGRQDLGTHEVQQAQAREMQTGSSSTMSVSSQSNVGGSAGFFGMGVSASSSLSTSLGTSTSVSTGQRSLSAESSRDVSQRTEQLSQSARSRRSTAIREVSQSETQEVSVRVVANYNRQHAMTVQYYEVLQVYELKTRVAKAERVVYIPMKVMDFDLATVSRFRERLMAIGAELGLDDLVARLVEFEQERAEKSPALKELEGEIEALERQIADFTGPGTLPRFAGRYEALSRRLESLEAERATVVASSNPFEKFKLLQLDANIGALRAQLDATEKQERATVGGMRGQLRKLQDKASQLRGTLSVSEKQLIEFLQRDRLTLNQLMWMRLDAYSVHRLLSNFTFRGEPLGGLVDPTPLGVFGNYVAFRWHFAEAAKRKAFTDRYVQPDKDSVTTRVVLPSDGVFAEAVLGQSNSAEKVDLTRFWDWNGSPIPILPPDMQAIAVESRARDVGMPGTGLEPSLASLPQLQALPGSDLGPLLQAIQAGNMFRNMSGIEQAAALAQKTAEGTAAGSTEAAKTALEAQKAYADALVKLANSDAGKAAMQLAMTAVPGGKAATVLGGLLNAAGGEAEATGSSGDGGGSESTTTGSSSGRRSRRR